MTTNAHGPRAVAAALSAAVLVLPLLFAQAAAADASAPALRMITIENAAHGDLVIAGKYTDAIDELADRQVRRHRFETYTNLCVAYVKTGQLDKAADACDDAVAAKHSGAAPKYRDRYVAHLGDERDLAIALSNRAVLRAVTGQLGLARNDMQNSVRLFRGLTAARQNSAFLKN